MFYFFLFYLFFSRYWVWLWKGESTLLSQTMKYDRGRSTKIIKVCECLGICVLYCYDSNDQYLALCSTLLMVFLAAWIRCVFHFVTYLVICIYVTLSVLLSLKVDLLKVSVDWSGEWWSPAFRSPSDQWLDTERICWWYTGREVFPATHTFAPVSIMK